MIEEYRRNGYVVLEDVVYPPMPDERESVYNDFRAIHAGDRNEFRACCRVLAAQVLSTEAFLSPPLLDAIEDLGVTHPAFFTSPVAHVMAPDLWADGVGAHQDWPALQTGLDTVVAWMPLFDVGLDDYPVEVVPGSHLLGLLPSKPGQHINEIDTTGMEFVPVPVKRGSVLLFSAFTVHRTRTPGTGFRAALSHRYENYNDPTFIARGCYSAQRRVIDREIKWAPTVEQVRKVFGQ
jgi:hypothetical protein